MTTSIKKMSLKNKAYACILSVGFIALLADRYSRSQPASAAGEAISPQSLLVTAAERKATPSLQGGSDPSIARMLRGAAQKSNWSSALAATARDPFSPWGAAGSGGASSPEGTAEESTTKFARSHKLTEIVAWRDQRRVLVDGHILSVGQTLDGYKLTAISARSATFENGGRRSVLALDKAPAAAVNSKP
jgi:hypothetical protein